ncbi:MAG TPA: NAD(P)/FAD-dependent oxidoreductase [Candidatus Sulfotelmatobacter sp.]|nr:NAD(P)/FAD-dependent oxidoreductase [Candidatus Sulfotelmatobacter sp.]
MNSKIEGYANGGAKPRVVIVGAGFGGLNAAKTLAHAKAQITVIDRKNHHTFQPLLYQVATAGLSPGEIAAPIRSILSSHKNVEVLMAEVTGFDLDRRRVETPDCEIAYDYVIVAAGARHSYFGHEDWEPFAPGLKTIEDALEIRRRVLLAFELAERQVAAGETVAPLNFVVVGGGPTGVELAGTLAEISHHALAHEYRAIDPKMAHILLLEGGPRVLPAYAEDLSRSAQAQLEHLGVEVRTSTVVTHVEAGSIHVGETRFLATVILWAAGVAASPLGRKLTADVDRAGRVPVEPDLSLPGHPEVFVIGDLATLKDENGKMLPGVAPVALQQGTFVAKLIRREIESPTEKSERSAPSFSRSLREGGGGDSRPRFHYWDKGSLATIGRAAAVAQFGKIHISGFVAWLSWLFVHILFLIGFRNRLLVFIQWAWSYVTYERGARLITGSTYLPGWTSPSASHLADPAAVEPSESANPEIHAAVHK